MKVNILIVALMMAALVWAIGPRLSYGRGEAIQVIATAYTCDSNPNNPMYPCGNPRWGGDRYSVGLACPRSWRNRYMEVPGYGVLRCDDTGAYDTWNGYPHIDIRVRTWGEAYNMGFRRMTIYAADGAAPAAVVQPAVVNTAPVATATLAPTQAPVQAVGLANDGAALQAAKKLAPHGDAQTAMARLVRADTAAGHFPSLVEGLSLAPEHALWLVSIWVPASDIPGDVRAKPNADAPVASRFFVFDAHTGQLLSEAFVSSDVVETMGWLASDSINLSQ